MKRIAFILSWLVLTGPAQALTPETQLRTFAACAGRLTAQLEHAWLFASEDSHKIERQRSQVVELLMAVAPSNRGRDILHWRIEARAAHRALLSRASFGASDDDATWAMTLAENYVADCTGFLLS